MGSANYTWRLVTYLSAAVVELLVLYGITYAFSLAKDFSALGTSQHFVVSVLHIAKLITLGVETLFVLFSFIITIFFLVLKREENFRKIWNYLLEFISEAIASLVLLLIASGLASIILTSDNSDPESIILNLAIYGLFYISLIGFFVLLVVSTFNSLKSRLTLINIARANVRENYNAN